MPQRPASNSSNFFPRPRVASLLPLAPPIQAQPPPEALSKLSEPSMHPFKDIILDSRLDGWSRSIHVYPAAYPRSLSGSSVHEAALPKFTTSRSSDNIAREIRAQNSRAHRRFVESEVDEPQLFIAVARYFISSELEENKSASADEDDPVTLILTHANSFHKETWEPMLAHLLVSPAGKKVREVWAVDSAQHGDSALLNQRNLGLTVDGIDYARDVLNLILFYLPDENSCLSAKIPIVLHRLECPDSSFFLLDKSPPPVEPNKSIHWRNRKLGLIGHSMGGTIAALAATSIPELFHHVILLDPVMLPIDNFCILHIPQYAVTAIRRRDRWKSSDVALEKFKKGGNPLSLWDPPALRRYVQYALESDQPTKLKCNKLHEASAAVDAHNRVSQSCRRLCDCYDNDGQPPFKLSLLLATPSKSPWSEKIIKQNPLVYNDKVAVKIASLGHLMVQENPREVAAVVCQSLSNPKAHLPSQVKLHHQNSKL